VTAQKNDKFVYHNVEYSIVGFNNDEPLDIASLGIQPTPVSTGCWRGYVAEYAIANNSLVLDGLSVTIWANDEQQIIGPEINGISPTGPNTEFDFFTSHYRGLSYPLAYSGKLLLGNGFIRDLYDHMGFHASYKYEHVVELSFDNGLLINETDRSEENAALRQTIILADKRKLGSSDTIDDIESYVANSFSRSFTELD